MPEAPQPASSLSNDFDKRLALLAFAISWFVSVWRVGPSSAWVLDYASLVGTIPGVVGYEGFVSAGLATVLRPLPIGSIVQRVALVSALGAALVAWFAYALAHGVLQQRSRHPRFNAWLAVAAALLLALGPTVQRFQAPAGSSNVAAALGLASLWLLIRTCATATGLESGATNPNRSRAFFLWGGVVAVTVLESHAVGLLTLVTAIGLQIAKRGPRTRQNDLVALAGFSMVVLCVGVPCFVARRTVAAASVERPAWDSLGRIRPFTGYLPRLDVWLNEFGLLWAGVAVFGIVVLVLQPEWRRLGWLFATLVAASLLLPHAGLPTDVDLGPVVIGACVLSICAAVGCQALLGWVTARRPSAFALGATLLLLAYAVTILAKSEELTFANNRYRSLGSEAWTDEALVALPAGALVLTRTPAITQRLVAAQVTERVRPDVLVVPIQRTTDAHLASALLALEPALTPVLRDMAINGKPSENALTSLADARPLFLEFDGNWDPRLRDHLLVTPTFHRVFSQTLGRSDRAAAMTEGQRTVSRILAATETSASSQSFAVSRDIGNVITRNVVDLRLREQLTLLLALGDRLAFETLVADYDRAFPRSEWIRKVRQRVGASTRGAVMAFDLLTDPERSLVAAP